MIKTANAVVGQSGGPTAAINASLAGVMRAAADSNGKIDKLYGMKNGIDGLLSEELIDLSGICFDKEKLSLLRHTPASALGSCRRRLPPPETDDAPYKKILSVLKKYNIHYFFYIGGNDSMDTVSKLGSYAEKNGFDLRVVGIPKTIDNDLPLTDHTPGFGSAAKYIATMTQEILRDCAVYTVPAVTIIEIMGRDTGWLTAAAALGRNICGAEPDLVYLPERDFEMNRFISDVRTALKKHPNVVVAVSEGIHFADGTSVGAALQSGASDVFGHKYLSGCGKALELAVKAEIGCKVRSVELNLCQRCASHIASETDLREAEAVGAHAVAAAFDGKSRIMITEIRNGNSPYTVSFGTVRVDDVANKTKYVPSKFINADGNNVTNACLEYLTPLIQGEVAPLYREGLPVHFVF